MPNILKIGAYLFAAIALSAFYLFGAKRTATPDLELLVFFDVSTSLNRSAIQSEADVAFQFINDPGLFPAGSFSIHISNRDVEQEPVIEETKTASTYPEDAMAETERLNATRALAAKELSQYAQQKADRDRTCLIKALHISPQLFRDRTKPENRRILLVSDMLEDCFSKGDPRTPEDLRLHIQQSLKVYPLPDLKGTQVYAAIVSSSPRPMDIEILRSAWNEALKPAHVSFSLGTVRELTHKRN